MLCDHPFIEAIFIKTSNQVQIIDAMILFEYPSCTGNLLKMTCKADFIRKGGYFKGIHKMLKIDNLNFARFQGFDQVYFRF